MVVSVNLDNRVIFVVGQVEIDRGQNLPKLLGRHLLMAMTVPVLEETFDVKTGAHAELVESLQQSVYTEFLIERVVLASIAVGKVALGNLLTRVGVL